MRTGYNMTIVRIGRARLSGLLTSCRLDEIRTRNLHATKRLTCQRDRGRLTGYARVLRDKVKDQVHVPVAVDIFHRRPHWSGLKAGGAKEYRRRIGIRCVKERSTENGHRNPSP